MEQENKMQGEEWQDRQRHKWHVYEVEKKRIQGLNLPAKEYNVQMAEVIERLKI